MAALVLGLPDSSDILEVLKKKFDNFNFHSYGLESEVKDAVIHLMDTWKKLRPTEAMDSMFESFKTINYILALRKLLSTGDGNVFGANFDIGVAKTRIKKDHIGVICKFFGIKMYSWKKDGQKPYLSGDDDATNTIYVCARGLQKLSFAYAGTPMCAAAAPTAIASVPAVSTSVAADPGPFSVDEEGSSHSLVVSTSVAVVSPYVAEPKESPPLPIVYSFGSTPGNDCDIHLKPEAFHIIEHSGRISFHLVKKKLRNHIMSETKSADVYKVNFGRKWLVLKLIKEKFGNKEIGLACMLSRSGSKDKFCEV
jgi:hypothetical protein